VHRPCHGIEKLALACLISLRATFHICKLRTEEANVGTPEQVDTEGLSLEDEKRKIREQLLALSTQLGKLTGMEQDRSKQCTQKKKKRRLHTFPDRKEKDKIVSIRISLPHETKGRARKGSRLMHSSPSTVLSTTNLSSFVVDVNAGSETESVNSSESKEEVDPLQGIASAKPIACNLLGSSKQHNTDEVVSSGLVGSFKIPAWRLAPEIDVPRFRLVDDYGTSDPHFGEGYDFLTAVWARDERINSYGVSSRALKKKKCHVSSKMEENTSEVAYQKFYRSSKRRSLPPTSSSTSNTTDPDIEDTSDAVYHKLHRSQKKAEKDRMTSLYNQKMREGKGVFALSNGKPSDVSSR
jgi:hypothetical protein